MRSIEEYNSLYETPEHLKDYIWGTRLGWEKYSVNPIIGGEYGTCFDLTLMKEAGKYRAWFSWRPKSASHIARAMMVCVLRRRRLCLNRFTVLAGKETS